MLRTRSRWCVPDVDAHYDRARAEGAQILTPPHDQPWGLRDYEALDLEGRWWNFSQRLKDVDPEDWARESSTLERARVRPCARRTQVGESRRSTTVSCTCCRSCRDSRRTAGTVRSRHACTAIARRERFHRPGLEARRVRCRVPATASRWSTIACPIPDRARLRSCASTSARRDARRASSARRSRGARRRAVS